MIMAEVKNKNPEVPEIQEEMHVISEISDAVEFLAPQVGKSKMRLSEGGMEYKTFFTKKFEERKTWKAPDPYKVLSHIPGSVIEIFVKPGQKVKTLLQWTEQSRRSTPRKANPFQRALFWLLSRRNERRNVKKRGMASGKPSLSFLRAR